MAYLTQGLYINTLEYNELLNGGGVDMAYESWTLSPLLWTLDSSYKPTAQMFM